MTVPRPAEAIHIGARRIGAGEPAYIIAEAGSNHDGDLRQAIRLVDAAVEAGADAVKFQTFSAERLAARTADAFATINVAGARTLYDLYQRLELPREWQREIRDYCVEKGIVFLSTAFDEEAIDQLDELGAPAFKVASLELVDLGFLRYAARKGKPLILSTGLADLGEIEDALHAVYGEQNHEVALLHCCLKYPADFDAVNLAAMETMRHAFQTPIGYSDHTPGIVVPIAAVARGANVIEKHFTVDRSLPGPDHSFALDPGELKAMVRAIRDTERAIGSRLKQPDPSEVEQRRYRRSLFARVDIPAGTTITADMLAVLRPASGLMPRYLDMVVGRAARKDIRAHDPIRWESI